MDHQLHFLHGDITDVPGIRVGHSTDLKAKTGVTVVLAPNGGSPAGLHVAGSASATRQLDSLSPFHVVTRIHGVCLCGGSGYGLDAGGGAAASLEAAGIGLPVVGHTVPIVPAAAIFDLGFGDPSRRPDWAMGAEAVRGATSGPILQGSVGAGTGATVGKLFGVTHGMKGGLGSASIASGELVIGALVVVNSFGDVTDGKGSLLAGARTAPESTELADALRLIREGRAMTPIISLESTTLAVIAVNAKADKIVASRIAAQATIGLARVIRPFQSQVDGDLTIVICAGDLLVDPNRIGLLAADALEQAVINAVCKADGFGLLPAWKDLPR
jgi:L-aminopeptidase/D-esterase-like protein